LWIPKAKCLLVERNAHGVLLEFKKVVDEKTKQASYHVHIFGMNDTLKRVGGWFFRSNSRRKECYHRR
jgi:hypothetical protein